VKLKSLFIHPVLREKECYVCPVICVVVVVFEIGAIKFMLYIISKPKIYPIILLIVMILQWNIRLDYSEKITNVFYHIVSDRRTTAANNTS